MYDIFGKVWRTASAFIRIAFYMFREPFLMTALAEMV